MTFGVDSELGFIFISILGLISVLMVAVIGMILYIIRVRKTVSQHEHAIDRMQDDLNGMCSGTVTLGKHLTSLDEKMRNMQLRQDQSELQESSSRSYTYAKKMAKNGAKLVDVIEDCGIAQGEAELIFLSTQMDRAS